MSYHHIWAPSTKRRSDNIVDLVMDIETDGLDASELLFGAVGQFNYGNMAEYLQSFEQDKISGCLTNVEWFHTWEQFYEIIDAYCQDNPDKKFRMWAHNGFSYDFTGAFTGEDWKDSSRVFRNGTTYCMGFPSGLKGRSTEWANMEFRDSYLLWQCGVSALGRAYGCPKGFTPEQMKAGTYRSTFGSDPENWPKEHLDYCLRDIEATAIAIFGFMALYNQWLGESDPFHYDLTLTGSSASFQVWANEAWPQHWEREDVDSEGLQKFSNITAEATVMVIAEHWFERWEEKDFDTETAAYRKWWEYTRSNTEEITLERIRPDGEGFTAWVRPSDDLGSMDLKWNAEEEWWEGTARQSRASRNQFTAIVKFTEPQEPKARWTRVGTCRVEANDMAENSYFGGMVWLNPKFAGRKVEFSRSADFNSHFPSQMWAHPMPDIDKTWVQLTESDHDMLAESMDENWMKDFQSEHIGRLNHMIRNYDKDGSKTRLFWGKFRLKKKADTTSKGRFWMPHKTGLTLDWRSDEVMTGWLSMPYVHYAVEECGYEIDHVHAYSTAERLDCFRDYVKWAYDQRLDAEDAGNFGLALGYKVILLNSLYGVFGMKAAKEVIEATDKVEKIMGEDGWEDRYARNFFDGKGELHAYLVSHDETQASRRTWFGFSSFITGWANVAIQRLLSDCGDRVLYCDTDSAHWLAGEEGWEPPSLAELKGRGLGEIKMEQSEANPTSIYWEPKAYTHYDDSGTAIKIKHKGVPKSTGNLTEPQRKQMIHRYKQALAKSDVVNGSAYNMTVHSRRYCQCEECGKKREVAA